MIDLHFLHYLQQQQLYLFQNNKWVSRSASTTNVADTFLLNGDFESGAADGGSNDAPTSWTRVGSTITCAYEGSNEYGGDGASLKMTGSGWAMASGIPNSYIHQAIDLHDDQFYNLNFVYAGATSLMYSIYDATASAYIKDWTLAEQTGGANTFKFLNQDITTNQETSGHINQYYCPFYVKANSGSVRSIRIQFSVSAASGVNMVDGITVFKAFNDINTMSAGSSITGRPFGGITDSWQYYQTQFTIPANYTNVSDWKLTLHGGKAGYQASASGSTNSQTVEFDDVRLESTEPDNFLFLLDNKASSSSIKIHSNLSNSWTAKNLHWIETNAKPVFTNVNGMVKISDGNFNNLKNQNKLMFFIDKYVAGAFKRKEWVFQDGDDIFPQSAVVSSEGLDAITSFESFDILNYISVATNGLYA